MIFLTIFFLIIIIGYPVWDYFYMKKINHNLLPKWRIYSEIMVAQWMLTVVYLVYWFSTGHFLQDLFRLENPLFPIQPMVFLSIGLGMVITIAILMTMIYISRTMKNNIMNALSDESIQFLIPSTFSERVLMFFVAVTAGICEEIIFRSAMLHYLQHLPLDMSIIAIGIVSSVLFGLIHLYQGWKGVLQTTYLGALFFFLFVSTGSLWVPIALHFITDVKFAFLPKNKHTDKTSFHHTGMNPE